MAARHLLLFQMVGELFLGRSKRTVTVSIFATRVSSLPRSLFYNFFLQYLDQCFNAQVARVRAARLRRLRFLPPVPERNLLRCPLRVLVREVAIHIADEDRPRVADPFGNGHKIHSAHHAFGDEVVSSVMEMQIRKPSLLAHLLESRPQ